MESYHALNSLSSSGYPDTLVRNTDSLIAARRAGCVRLSMSRRRRSSMYWTRLRGICALAVALRPACASWPR